MFCQPEELSLPAALVLNDPLVILQFVFERRLVRGQVSAFTDELLQGPLGFLDLLS